VGKGQKYYSLRPGVVCRRCAGSLMSRGELPNDPRTKKGLRKLAEFRTRLAAGAVTLPFAPSAVPASARRKRVSQRKLEVKGERDVSALFKRFREQQARIKAQAELTAQKHAYPKKKLPGS
jgi:hypothetical protein